MEWVCCECTYKNSSDDTVCVMCEQGYRLFSENNENELESEQTDDSLVGSGSSEIDEQNSLSDTCRKRNDIYIRHDGQVLYSEKAGEERKRSIAKRKALDLKKLWEKRKMSSILSTNVLKTSVEGTSQHKFKSTSKGHFNALSAHVKGVNTTASSTAEGACISTVNAHVTGGNASASASASGVRINALNANVTGVSTSASATADGLSVAAGNVSVTGAEAALSASASAAKVTVGNVDINGVSAGASAKINGTGVSAFNVCIGGPSASASVSVDGGLSFGNVNLGLRPSLDIGLGLNIGIPFLSGSKLGSGGGDGGNGNNGGGEGDNNNQGRLADLQQTLLEKFPNRRYYRNPVDYPITRNTSGESIDPLLPNDDVPRTNNNDPNVDNVVNRHNELVENGQTFVGFKGYAPTNESSSNPQESEWSGFYTSPSPDVAGGYAVDSRGRSTHISRVYIPKNAAPHYSTNIGLETKDGLGARHAVKEHSNEKYIFSGPQSSTDPDLFAPETVMSPAVRNEVFESKSINFESSAHQMNSMTSRNRFEEYPIRELECSKIVPDYIVGKKTADDCARDGGRERLAHVFQGYPPYISPNVPPKQKDLDDDDLLLLEECKKLGIEIDPNNLGDYKKDMKSDAEYEQDEDAENLYRQQQNANTKNGENSEKKNKKEEEEEETDDKPPEACKNHSINVRCMKCMNGSSGPRIRQIQGRIHGFKFSK